MYVNHLQRSWYCRFYPLMQSFMAFDHEAVVQNLRNLQRDSFRWSVPTTPQLNIDKEGAYTNGNAELVYLALVSLPFA